MKVLTKNGRDLRVYEDGTVERAPNKRWRDWEVCKWSDNGNGYYSVGASGKRIYVHRLVAEAYLKKPSEDHTQVNHIDGNKGNNHYTNLEWITPSNNIQHAHKEGLMRGRVEYGSTTYRSEEDIVAVYSDIVLNGMGITEAAKKHGFSRTTVSSFINKRSRRYLTDPIDEIASKLETKDL